MELSQRIQQLLDSAIVAGELAGASVLVMKNGKELAYTQAGFADREKGRPFTRDTIARLFSMTKPVTAVASMILMERGVLDFGQALGDVLPWFREVQVWENGKRTPARRNILIKDLLNMTSGLPYGASDAAGLEAAKMYDEAISRLYGENPMTTMEITKRLAAGGLSFQPGSQWMYGSSADVLGAAIEQITGMTLGDFLQKELFTPLGMKDTDFYVPQRKQDRLAQIYESTPEGMKPYETNNLAIQYTMERNPAFQSGGAGLCGTIDDYARFAQMLLQGGSYDGIQILRPETVEYLTTGKLMPWQQDSLWRSWESMLGYGYSNLLRILEEPKMSAFHGWKGEYGWDGWLGTYFCNSPENGVTVLMFTQRRDSGTMPITRKLRNVIYTSV